MSTYRRSQDGSLYFFTLVTENRRALLIDAPARLALRQAIERVRQHYPFVIHAWVLMPDHLHWLLQLQNEDLTRLVGRVKSISAKRLGRPIWQKGFHDHALRREEDVRSVARYVVANPLRAGLVERAGDYPHWDAVWI